MDASKELMRSELANRANEVPVATRVRPVEVVSQPVNVATAKQHRFILVPGCSKIAEEVDLLPQFVEIRLDKAELGL